jgi:ribosomal protein RSM22 (predicted rRNA methylase)
MPRIELPADLRGALDGALAGMAVRDLSGAVDGLIERYRSPGAATDPILARPVDVVAYAAYRLPATFAAVVAALTQATQAVPSLAPKSQLDLGGGAGAAAWQRLPSSDLATLEVVDRVPAAPNSTPPGARRGPAVLRTARWRIDRPTGWPADLVTVSYLLAS